MVRGSWRYLLNLIHTPSTHGASSRSQTLLNTNGTWVGSKLLGVYRMAMEKDVRFELC